MSKKKPVDQYSEFSMDGNYYMHTEFDDGSEEVYQISEYEAIYGEEEPPGYGEPDPNGYWKQFEE